MLSQREKFVYYFLSIMNASTENERLADDDFLLALLEVLREGKCDELSVQDTKEIMKGIEEEMKAGIVPEIVKDVMKKLG